MLEESTGNFSASRNVYDWYQTNTHVHINIMIKNLTESDVKVRLIDETLDVSCNLADGSEFNLHFNLFKSIFVNESSWTVTPSKLEIKLKKMDRKRWQSLETIPEKGPNNMSNSSSSSSTGNKRSPSSQTPGSEEPDDSPSAKRFAPSGKSWDKEWSSEKVTSCLGDELQSKGSQATSVPCHMVYKSRCHLFLSSRRFYWLVFSFLPFLPSLILDQSFASDFFDDMSDGRVKYDWYQSDSHVTVSVMIRNLVQSETQVAYGDYSATALIKLPDGSDYKLQLILHHQIIPDQSTFHITPCKLELKMAKASDVRWPKLEADPNTEAEEAVNSLPVNVEVVSDGQTDETTGATDQLVEAVACAAASIDTQDGEVNSDPVAEPASEPVPVSVPPPATTTSPQPEQSNGLTDNGSKISQSTSSPFPKAQPVGKGPKNWDKIVKEFEEEEEKNGEKDVNDLFKQIYTQGDEDLRRAMNKSFQESGGTVLSTNWKEVQKEKVEVKPPDDCEFKKWD